MRPSFLCDWPSRSIDLQQPEAARGLKQKEKKTHSESHPAKKWKFRSSLHVSATHLAFQHHTLTCKRPVSKKKKKRTTGMMLFYPSPASLCPFCFCQTQRFTGSKVTGSDTRPLQHVCAAAPDWICVCAIMLAGFVGAVRAQHIVQQAAILPKTEEEMTQGGGSFLSTGVCSLAWGFGSVQTVKWLRLCLR